MNTPINREQGPPPALYLPFLLVAAAAVARWGYWGYYAQFFAVSLVSLGALHLVPPELRLRTLVLWSLWLLSGVVAALLGPQHQMGMVVAETVLLDSLLLIGAGLGLAIARLELAQRVNLQRGLCLLAAGLALIRPLIDPALMWSEILPAPYGREPHLLGSSESLELAAVLLAVAVVIRAGKTAADTGLAWFVGSGIIVLLASIWTGSRSAAAATCLILAAAFLFDQKRSALIRKGIVLGASAALVGVVWWGMTNGVLRARLLATALDVFWLNPFGLGRGSFDLALAPTVRASIDAMVYWQGMRFWAPDSFLTGVLIERGLLGLLVVVTAIVVFIRRVQQEQQAGWFGVGAAILVLLLLSDLSYIPPAWFMLGVLGGILGAQSRSGEQAIQTNLPLRWLWSLAAALALMTAWHRVLSQNHLETAREAMVLGNIGNAETQLLEYAGRSLDHADGWQAVAKLRVVQANPKGAVDAYEQAVQARPEFVQAAKALTRLYGEQQRSQAALAMMDIWYPPAGFVSEPVWAAAAYALALEKQNVRALQVAEAGLRQYPSSIDMRRIKARLHMIAGDWLTAQQQWTLVLQRRAANEQDRIYYNVVLEELGLSAGPGPLTATPTPPDAPPHEQ